MAYYQQHRPPFRDGRRHSPLGHQHAHLPGCDRRHQHDRWHHRFSPSEHDRRVADEQQKQQQQEQQRRSGRSPPNERSAGPLRRQGSEYHGPVSREYHSYHRRGDSARHQHLGRQQQQQQVICQHDRDERSWNRALPCRNDGYYSQAPRPPAPPAITRMTDTRHRRQSRRRQGYDNIHRPPSSGHRKIQTVTDTLRDYTARQDKLKPYEVALVWNRLGKSMQRSGSGSGVGHTNRQLVFWDDNCGNLQSLMDHTMELLNKLDPVSIAIATHGVAKLVSLTTKHDARFSYHVQPLWESLQTRAAHLLREHKIDDAQSISNILWAYGKAVDMNKQLPHGILDDLSKAAVLHIESFTPQHLSNTVWACARLNHEAPALFDAVAATVQARIRDFNPQSLANTAWAFAKVSHRSPKLLDAIAAAAQARIHDFHSQGLANTAWAYAKLNHVVPTLLDAIATAAASLLNDFCPQALANTVWSYAKLGHNAPKLLDAIAAAVKACISNCTPQDLSNTAWAYATLSHKAPSLFQAIAAASEASISRFKAQGLTNTAWAYAVMDCDIPTLFHSIATAAESCIDDFTPQELANTVWAYAKIDRAQPALLDAVAIAAAAKTADFSPQEIANTVWAYAKLNHRAPALFNAFAASAERRISHFDAQALANTVWAYATLDHEVPALLKAIAFSVEAHIDDFTPQALANTAWAYAVFDAHADQIILPESRFAKALLSTKNLERYTDEEYRQLHQYSLWYKERTGHDNNKNDLGWFSTDVKRRCMGAFLKREACVSELQNSVVSALGTLAEVGEVREEFLTGTGYRLDAVVLYRGCPIAVEVDGPSHFIGKSHTRTGSTVLKQRQLRSLEGWKLVSVPYWEWDEITQYKTNDANNTQQARKHTYLKGQLDRLLETS